MYDYITLESADGSLVARLHADERHGVVRATGLIGASAPRDAVSPRPEWHGARDLSRFRQAALLTVEGEVWGTTRADALDAFDELTAIAAGTLDAPGWLKWQHAGGGDELQAAVKLAAELKPPVEGNVRFIPYNLQLRAADPFAYGAQQAAMGATLAATGGGRGYPLLYPYAFSPTGGGKAAFTVGGRVPTSPVVTIHGRCVDPIVQLDSTGERIAITGTIGSAETLVIDMARPGERSVRLNGLTDRMDLIDFAQSSWWQLPPGPQSVSLLSSEFDDNARVELTWRPAWPL